MSTRPAASSAIVRSARPTVRGWAFAVMGVVALAFSAYLGRTDLLFVGLFLTLSVVAALVVVGRMRPNWEVHRSFGPEIVEVGDVAHDVINVRNRDARPVPASTWHSRVPHGIRAEARGEFARLDAFSLGRRGADHSVLRRRLATERRGRYELGAVTLRRTDSLGLVSADWLVATSRTLLVTPRVVALEWSQRDSDLGGGLDRELLAFALPNADEVGVREYRTGDPLRRVHWNATARHGELMVRQEDRQSGPNAWLLYDTHHVHRGADSRHADEFEALVEFVASLGTALLAHGFTLGVAETGGTHGVEMYDSERGHEPFAQMLAITERASTSENTGIDSLVGQIRRSGRAAPVFVVLAAEVASAAELVELRRQAALAVVFLLGPARGLASELRADGWTCVVVDDDVDVRDAWAMLRGGAA